MRALGNTVLVKTDKPSQKSSGGIYFTSEQPAFKGVVVSLGAVALEKKELSVGDTVVFRSHSHSPLPESDLVALDYNSIIAVHE